MNWEDEGYLLYKRKFRENGSIINVFTENYGRVSGIVYGGNSRKIRNYLQISNKIFIFYNAKNSSKIGYFKTELIKPISPIYFNDRKRTSALLSSTSLLNILLPEAQPYKNIYDNLTELLINLNNKNWCYLYIFWELNILKELGFDPNLKLFKANLSNEEIVNIKVDNIKYKLPSFLITGKIPLEVDTKLLYYGLIFTRSIMLSKFFLPNNLIFPKARILLEKYFS